MAKSLPSRRMFTGLAALAVLGLAAIPSQAQTFTRKPFLQKGSSNTASVCWQTNSSAKLEMKYGKAADALDQTVTQAAAATDGCLEAKGLDPKTKYFYEIYNGTTKLAGSAEHYFITHPPKSATGKYTFWIVGDAGTGSSSQKAVRDAFAKVNASAHADALILLGDNAYEDGTPAELTAKMFNIYPTTMSNTFSWAAIGNHEDNSRGVGHLAAWYHPTEGQSGGVASKSELYFSFDYGNVHWICLDSEQSGKATGDPMYKWLEQDLQAAKQDWIIAFWHTSPYSWGTHDSDEEGVEMRQRFVALLEKYGVDMVFTGHSHNYERSHLLNGAYGNSSDNKAKASSIFLDTRKGTEALPYKKASNDAGNQGAIYTVAGSSGDVGDIKGVHPVMIMNLTVMGSVILTIEDNKAFTRFVDDKGTIRDSWHMQQPGHGTKLARPAQSGKTLFRFDGRNLSFSGNSEEVFRLYATDGKVLLQQSASGQMALDPKRFPAGDYYYRFGSEVGSLTLP